mgnify:CR=1 FL=1
MVATWSLGDQSVRKASLARPWFVVVRVWEVLGGGFPGRESCKVQAILGEESVVAMMLQMDKYCSFNLPIRCVVFNRIREVDLDVDERELC